MTMKYKTMIKIFVPVLVLILILSVSRGTDPVSAASGRNGNLHVTKECSAYTGAAGSFCTITSSNIAEIKVGSKVFYDQAAGIPAGMLDSNVVLDAGNGNRAVGRCTLDLATYKGLCTFSNGTGDLAEFRARVDVSLGAAGIFHWDGTYSFTPAPGIDDER
jgi:hypothetical protein